MKQPKPVLKEVERLIHKTYFLREKTTDIVMKAEYEERLNHLFTLKKQMEEEITQVRIIARVSKKRHIKYLQTAVLIAGKNVGSDGKLKSLHKSQIQSVAT